MSLGWKKGKLVYRVGHWIRNNLFCLEYLFVWWNTFGYVRAYDSGGTGTFVQRIGLQPPIKVALLQCLWVALF